jgi:hypothetical protein
MGTHALLRRILFHLERAEEHEPNPHFQDDYRIAWITVLKAASGVTDPHVQATRAVLGLHPDKVWPAIEARRHAKLGAEYNKFFGTGSSPKKPVQSARFPGDKKGGDRAA